MTELATPAPAAAPTTTPPPALPAEGTQTQTDEPVKSGDEGAPQADQTATQETPEKHESKFRRRLDRQREKTFRAEAENKFLKEQLAQLQQGAAATPAAAQDEPKLESYGSYEDYIKALSTWHAERHAQKILDERLKTETAKRSTEQLNADWDKKLVAARAKYDDFDETLDHDDIPITPAMNAAIRESEQAMEIVYYLGKNPEEAERIVNLPPRRQYAEIVILETKVKDQKPAPKAASKAPEPIAPLGGSGANVGSDAPSENDDMATWIRKRRAQIRKQSGR